MGRKLGAESRLIDEILQKGRGLKEQWIQESGVLLRLLRRRLKMTQAQLAKKSGVPQTNIANIESGKKRATLPTLEKLFSGMGFRLALLPVGEKKPDELIKVQAKKAASNSLQAVFGSMGLEDQMPTARKMKEMVEEESHRLIQSETSRIWDE
ncbi:MAG: hypothetical protein K1000chlam3_01778 [Chlamydiae bacterium]|nr:hypothetical protein [Chlamydiota bacterium]